VLGDLRLRLPLVDRVREGARFTVLYRRRCAFQIIPIDEPEAPRLPLDADPLYRAAAVGRSSDGRTHDRINMDHERHLRHHPFALHARKNLAKWS
jgi:antitoxin (DNA-binding transcriptional repressor) of toxin-antitoxin stability system